MYECYETFVNSLTSLDGFKSRPEFQYMLEHVSGHQGEEYLNFLVKELSLGEIKAFCELNDKVGNPVNHSFCFGTASPTSLRYLHHALLILKYIGFLSLSRVHLVEVGGGYGGLFLALHYVARLRYPGISFEQYIIIDLPGPLKLQEKYLVSHGYVRGKDVDFKEASTHGSTVEEGKEWFLVSNYCFSEICDEYQQQYRQHLFPKVSHGFMAWNIIPVYDFGFSLTIEEEYPKTAPNNKYIYF